jgi:hypothetical protein
MLNTRESRNACKDKESRQKLIKLFKIMETKDELKKAEVNLSEEELNELESTEVSGGKQQPSDSDSESGIGCAQLGYCK